MKKLLLAVAVFGISTGAFASPSRSPQECSIPEKDQAALLQLSYSDFDQTPDKGWRKFGEAGCYLDTATLIDQYHQIHFATLDEQQNRLLLWHAGQMHAFHSNYVLARERFLQALNPNESVNTPGLWNDYVHATVAFLDRDEKTLTYYRDRMAMNPAGNLDFVKGLLKCIQYAYRYAYSSPACRQ